MVPTVPTPPSPVPPRPPSTTPPTSLLSTCSTVCLPSTTGFIPPLHYPLSTSATHPPAPPLPKMTATLNHPKPTTNCYKKTLHSKFALASWKSSMIFSGEQSFNSNRARHMLGEQKTCSKARRTSLGSSWTSLDAERMISSGESRTSSARSASLGTVRSRQLRGPGCRRQMSIRSRLSRFPTRQLDATLLFYVRLEMIPQ